MTAKISADNVFPFAEFYPANTPIAIEFPNKETNKFEERIIYRFGDARLVNKVTGEEVITPEEFHATFPDGVLPADDDEEWEWLNNAWFNTDSDDADETTLAYSISEYLPSIF